MIQKYTLTGICCFAGLMFFFSCSGLPGPGGEEKEAAAVRQEIEVGRSALAKIAGSSGVVHHREATDYLNRYLLSLARYGQRQELPYRCIILASEQVNAYALPGGYIALTLGTLKEIRTPEELAGILAHELGHVNLRHILDSVKIQVAPDFLETLGKIIAGSRLVITGSIDRINQAIAEKLFLEGYASDQEYEADAYAQELLSALGIGISDYKNFLQRLSDKPGDPGLQELDRTHPPLASRLERLNLEPQDQRELPQTPAFHEFLKQISQIRTEK